MSKLVIGIIVLAVIVGIFMFSSRDEPALAPRNVPVAEVQQGTIETVVVSADNLAGASSSVVDAQRFGLSVDAGKSGKVSSAEKKFKTQITGNSNS